MDLFKIKTRKGLPHHGFYAVITEVPDTAFMYMVQVGGIGNFPSSIAIPTCL
jgi:hypothetical protein